MQLKTSLHHHTPSLSTGAFRTSYTSRSAKALCLQKQRKAVKTSAAVVHESLTLLPLDTATNDTVAELVDKLWSMQYVVPGPICGCAGDLVPLSVAGAVPPPAASHAVLFRYGQQAMLERFLGHLKTKEAVKNCANISGKDVVTYHFEGNVPNELQSIFRKGPEYEAGHELIVALNLQDNSPPEDAIEFLNLTQQLATSSAYGAVQASYGKCTEATNQQPEEAATTTAAAQAPAYMMMVRFQSAEQLEGFVTCPPVAAMLEGDALSPLKAVWAGALVIESPEEEKQQGMQGGGLM